MDNILNFDRDKYEKSKKYSKKYVSWIIALLSIFVVLVILAIVFINLTLYKPPTNEKNWASQHWAWICGVTGFLCFIIGFVTLIIGRYKLITINKTKKQIYYVAVNYLQRKETKRKSYKNFYLYLYGSEFWKNVEKQIKSLITDIEII